MLFRSPRPTATDRVRPRPTARDRPRPTARDRPRPTASDRDRLRPPATDRARPRPTSTDGDRPRPTLSYCPCFQHGGSCYQPGARRPLLPLHYLQLFLTYPPAPPPHTHTVSLSFFLHQYLCLFSLSFAASSCSHHLINVLRLQVLTCNVQIQEVASAKQRLAFFFFFVSTSTLGSRARSVRFSFEF